MTGAFSAQQGLLGVAANITRPAGKPDTRELSRVTDSTGARLGAALPNRQSTTRLSRRNSQSDQSVEPYVAPATLLEASLIASTLPNPDETGFSPAPHRMTPWQPPLSSLPLRDRSV
ncbi:hypothetical protein [Pelagibacterium mangrovi]|uniref:hypothetical protein n=1 Tax=Pelagibacterium mangrovi TaxID=3119828 RepID=UPI002FC6DFF2